MSIPLEQSVVYSPQQKDDVWAQLQRLKQNSHFSHSKRFPSFLTYIIEEELSGRGEQLKERTVGIEVFGRKPGYDTTSDPIVRVTAAEIRKRIAQYYQEPGHAAELRIALPSGSYVPHFDWPAELGHSMDTIASTPLSPLAETGASHSLEAPALHLVPTPLPVAIASAPKLRRLPLLAALATVLALGAAAIGWRTTHPHPGEREKFWAPVLLAAGNPVVICYPRSQLQTMTLRDAAQPERQHTFQEQVSALVLDDVQPLVSIAALLGTTHRQYLLMDDTATLTDLRRGPTIFLGAFDNAWTLRMTHDLRFRFGNDPEMKRFWIEDTQNPAQHWQIDRGLQVATNNYKDYAIVARFTDASTGQLAVITAGIARGGTVAAGEFLTQPGAMDALRTQAPAAWGGQNMEFVLSTGIIDGRSAPPKIEAMYFW